MGRGRFAPSPSGRMHLGNVFSACLAWCSARVAEDEFMVRLEDMDDRCAARENRLAILDDLAWLGVDWDIEPYIQSQHAQCYEHALDTVASHANIYPCFCSRADLHAASAPHASDGTFVYQGTCKGLTPEQIEAKSREKSPAWRIEVPNREISLVDLCQGGFVQNLSIDCGDFVIRRGDGVFAYQLAVCADDIANGITQVVRGSDLLGSTPRQIWLWELMSAKPPAFAHHPLLLAPDGKRLSKREKSLDMGSLREAFGAPEPLLGWMSCLMGLNESAEPCTLNDILSCFSWDKIKCEDIVLAPFGPIETIY